MAPHRLRLTYFPFPGRAETARLMLTMHGVEHEDRRVSNEEWATLKPSMPFEQIPVLEVDGQPLPQMYAIDRFCGTLCGMLPEGSPLDVAQAEASYFFIEDIWQPVGKELAVLGFNNEASDDDKAAAAARLLSPDGMFCKRLAQLDARLAAREGPFIGGQSASYVDLAIFNVLSLFQSGWIERMPLDLLKDYPALKAFRHRVASLPQVAAFYEKETDAVRTAGYRPDSGDAAEAGTGGEEALPTAGGGAQGH